jgi:hypothetical protein
VTHFQVAADPPPPRPTALTLSPDPSRAARSLPANFTWRKARTQASDC